MQARGEPCKDSVAADGYPAIAEFMARDPDNETYVFRKFDGLTARMLLYRQAELISLEAELSRLDRKIMGQGQIDLDMSMRSWNRMHYSEAKEIMELRALCEKIENRLQTYHETLLRQSDITKLQRPSKRVMSAYKTEVHGYCQSPGDFSKLASLDRELLEDRSDLVALRPPAHTDLLSRTVRDHWPLTRSSVQFQHTWHFEERTVVKVVGFISTAIAAFLLAGSIVTLYFVTNPSVRLGTMLGFVLLFALSLRLCTEARRDSIFAATAAYSAVLVVFISGNLTNNGAV